MIDWNFTKDYKKFTRFIHDNSVIFDEYKTINLSPIKSTRNWKVKEGLTLVNNLPETDLEHLLVNRRTIRKPMHKDVSLNFISKLLQFSCGISDSKNGYFTYPSPGATYSTVVLLYSEYIDGNIIYRYNPGDHLLEEYRDIDKNIISKIVNDNQLNKFKTFIFLASDYQLIEERYKFATYRLLCQENGHIAQNILLYLTENNMNAVPYGGFLDHVFKSRVDSNLDLHYMIVMG